MVEIKGEEIRLEGKVWSGADGKLLIANDMLHSLTDIHDLIDRKLRPGVTVKISIAVESYRI